jgi:DNA-binding LacI/PurR family transcriptional regulator
MTLTRKAATTIGDIARLAGVSKSTVSRALNDSQLISRETKDRIRAIADERSFSINAPARRLSLRQSRTIAYVSCVHTGDFTVADQFDLEIMSGIADGLGERGYDMLVVHIASDRPDWAKPYLDSGRVDGFVLLAGTSKIPRIEHLLAIDAPFIAWGVPAPGRSYCSVCSDDMGGGRLAARHFLNTGRRRIAFLGGPASEVEVRMRLEGFRAELEEAGVDLPPELIAYGDYCDFGKIATAMEALLDRAPDIDAVFASADMIAIIALEILHKRGRRVPVDVGVIGYDDVSLATITNPPLTTIRQGIRTAGQLLAHNLIQYLETGEITNTIIPASLVIRKSA